MTAAAAAASAWPDAFVLDRARLGAGEAWRLFTCHLAHGNALHLVLNLVAALLLLLLARPTALLVAVAPLHAWLTLVVRKDLGSYRGLSGLLHVHAAAALVAYALRTSGRARLLAALGLLVVVGKGVAEVALPGSLTSGLALGVVPVPEAHLLGAVLGAAAGAAAAIPARSRQIGDGRDARE